MQVETMSQRFQRILATNATDASFPSRIDTFTQPALALSTGLGGAISQNIALIKPFGIGSDDNTFKIRVYAWTYTSGIDTALIGVKAQWTPVLLLEATCTLCTAVGLAGGYVLSTERYADTIDDATAFESKASIEIISPTGNVPGHIMLDIKGAQMIECVFDMNGSATSANALVRFF